MSKAGPTDPAAGEAGYTYAALLIALVVLALGAQAALIPTSTQTRRAMEDELIHRGLAYAQAIESYWRADPEAPTFPPNLDALLNDPRKTGRRHIRRLLDPVIADEWQVVRAEEGGVAGVSPRSEETPFRKADFPEGLTASEQADHYSDWQFAFDPNADAK